MAAVKGQTYTDYLTLPSRTTNFSMQVNPTIAAGDVKVVKDGGAAANITTLPTVSGTVVTYTLSATETNADLILVLFKDQSADEWVDVTVKIETTTSGAGALTLSEIEASTILAKQSGFAGLATTTNVTDAQAAIVAEVDAVPTATSTAAAIRAEIAVELARIIDLAKIHGLLSGVDLVVTPTGRTAGDVVQNITEVGTTVTVSRV